MAPKKSNGPDNKGIKCKNMMYEQQEGHLPFPVEELEVRIKRLKPTRYINAVAAKIGDKPQSITKWDKRANNGFSYLLHVTFGKEILDEQEQDAFQTASTALALADGTYTLQIMMSARTVNQLTEAFWRLLPTIGIAVLAISLIVSYFVTRLLTKPILEISDISKRLTALDMTWRCDTSRTDEVGTLALNLNTMAARLDNTLKELSEANEKLQADIEQERQQEKLRIDFFRAVSHELKTPITVLKGEIEGMIYQVGEYKDRDTHLRQSLRTVNDGGFELIDGSAITDASRNEVLVHEKFAQRNGLVVGDSMLLGSVEDGNRTHMVTVTGIFRNTKEQDSIGIAPSCDLYKNIVFAAQWMKNITAQRFTKEKAVAERDGEDIEVFFSLEGAPITAYDILMREADAITAQLLNNESYTNARMNSDEQSSRDECLAAISRIVASMAETNAQFYNVYFDAPLAAQQFRDYLFETTYQQNLATEQAPVSAVTLYREALALLVGAVRGSSFYDYLRDRETDYDSARDELDAEIAAMMEEIREGNSVLHEAYHSLPHGRR